MSECSYHGATSCSTYKEVQPLPWTESWKYSGVRVQPLAHTYSVTHSCWLDYVDVNGGQRARRTVVVDVSDGDSDGGRHRSGCRATVGDGDGEGVSGSRRDIQCFVYGYNAR